MTTDDQGRPVGPNDARREAGRREAEQRRRRFPGVELATGITILTVIVGVVAIVVTQLVLAAQQQSAIESAVVRLTDDLDDLVTEIRSPEGLPTRAEVIEVALRVDRSLSELAGEVGEIRDVCASVDDP